jgi:Scavenger receptor cysteine-rich domain
MCYKFVTDPGTVGVRLAGSTLVGRLELYQDEEWGAVCNEQFDDYDAQVACSMYLGYK